MEDIVIGNSGKEIFDINKSIHSQKKKYQQKVNQSKIDSKPRPIKGQLQLCKTCRKKMDYLILEI